MAVHSIGNAPMSRNRITEVLDLEGTLKTRGEETSEWGNQRGESCENEDVNLHWCHGEGLCNEMEPDWELVCMRDEDGVGGALEAGPNVCSEILAYQYYSQYLQRRVLH